MHDLSLHWTVDSGVVAEGGEFCIHIGHRSQWHSKGDCPHGELTLLHMGGGPGKLPRVPAREAGACRR
jgi:hypothetical protein